MVTCKKCGFKGEYSGKPCPLCNAKLVLSEEELACELNALCEAVKSKNYETAIKGYRMLAEDGYTEAEKEYAKLLEKGRLVAKDYNLAMEYFYRAAKKNDAYAAYRYSRLKSRESDDISFFWLVYSAVLGCAEAVSDTADEFVKKGYHEDALHFYLVASESGNADAIVRLAEMYCSGTGVPKNEGYAKWYMDKLRLPPIYAIKLAYKLRGAIAKEPPPEPTKRYNATLFRLKKQASDYGFTSAHLKLCNILAERGDTNSIAEVGNALIQGNGCEQNFEQGLRMLTRAAAQNNLFAHISLANLYSSNKYTDKNISRALEHYETAGRLGDADSYEKLGDFYSQGDEIELDFSKALEYYDRALKLGSLSALKKYDGIKEKRIVFFNEALSLEKTLPEKAFSLYTISSDMGHAEATYRLAVLCEFGIGTKKDRKKAFSLYNKAVKLGYYDALLSLGVCYAKGIGTKLDYRQAKDALTKAERLGIIGTNEAIKAIMEQKKKKIGRKYYSVAMRLIHMKKFDSAKTYLDAAAELSYPRAIYTLGCLYEFGMGAPCDKDKAFALYEKAYSLFFRDPRAKYKLSVLRMLKAK